MYDFHTHTAFSEDSDTPMGDMISAAEKLGIQKLAVTDHCDPDFPDPVWSFYLDFEDYWHALCEKEEEHKNRIDILKGIEIGIQNGDTLAKCRDAVEMFPYDIVIGSFHAFNGHDLDRRDFTEMEQDEIVPRFYENMYSCLLEYSDFDIVGHFNLIDRYIDFKPDYSAVRDIIAEILDILIKEDKTIEINTSSYRYGMGEHTHASKEILELYHDLGGRNVSYGSDAHSPEYLGCEYKKACGILQAAGFEKLSVYKRRQRSEVDF